LRWSRATQPTSGDLPTHSLSTRDPPPLTSQRSWCPPMWASFTPAQPHHELPGRSSLRSFNPLRTSGATRVQTSQLRSCHLPPFHDSFSRDCRSRATPSIEASRPDVSPDTGLITSRAAGSGLERYKFHENTLSRSCVQSSMFLKRTLSRNRREETLAKFSSEIVLE